MQKKLIISIVTGTMSLTLISAHASNSTDTVANNESVITSEQAIDGAGQALSVMDQPVNFSTPDEVEKSLQKVREQEGDIAYSTLNNAMKYILYYDLSLGGKKENLYGKLDGKTPAQIIDMMKR